MVHFPKISFMARSMKSLNVANIPVAWMSSGQGIDDTRPYFRRRASIEMSASDSESIGSSFWVLGLKVITQLICLKRHLQ